MQNFSEKELETLKIEKDKLVENRYILAFRLFTRALISYNMFVKIDTMSHLKFPG